MGGDLFFVKGLSFSFGRGLHFWRGMFFFVRGVKFLFWDRVTFLEGYVIFWKGVMFLFWGGGGLFVFRLAREFI